MAYIIIKSNFKGVQKMAKKKKIAKLTDQQYFEYIMSLKDDAALFCANGEMLVPDEIKKDEDKKEE